MWSEENIKEEFMWNQIFPRLAAVADRAYREADWEDIYDTSSWNAVQSKNFTDDFGTFRYSLAHFHRYIIGIKKSVKFLGIWKSWTFHTTCRNPALDQRAPLTTYTFGTNSFTERRAMKDGYPERSFWTTESKMKI